MNLFDFLRKNKKYPEANSAEAEKFEFPPVVRDPEANSAGLKPDGTVARKIEVLNPAKKRLSFTDMLFGQASPATDSQKSVEGDYTLKDENGNDVNYTPNVDMSISENPRVGGLFNDIGQGFRENMDNGFSIDNFGKNKLADGRNKGFAYKLGEGVGSLARFAQTPLGRSVIVGGIVGATGGNPLQMLAYGSQTGALNQQYRNNDKIYRNDLLQNAKQQLMNSPEWNTLNETEKAQIMNDLQNNPAFTGLKDDNKKQEMIDEATRVYLGNRQNGQLKELEDNINNLRGYVTNDTYNNLMKSQQIRDNYAYRNMMLDNQMKQNEIMNQLRQDQFKAQQDQNAFNNWYKKQSLANDQQRLASDNAYKNAQLGLGYANLEEKRNARELKNYEKQLEKQNEFKDVENQLKAFEKTFKTANNPYRYRAFGWGSDKLNTLSKEEANFNAQRTLLFNQIARKLGGEKGVLSDQDIKRIEGALPSLSDTYEQKQAKMRAVYQLLNIRKGVTGNTQKDPLGIR